MQATGEMYLESYSRWDCFAAMIVELSRFYKFINIMNPFDFFIGMCTEGWLRHSKCYLFSKINLYNRDVVVFQ